MINVKDCKAITTVISDAGFEPGTWVMVVWYFTPATKGDRPFSWAIIPASRLKDWVEASKGEIVQAAGFDVTNDLEQLANKYALGGVLCIDAIRARKGEGDKGSQEHPFQ